MKFSIFNAGCPDKTNNMSQRFVAKQKGASGAWLLYDKERKCFVLQSVSPNAKYNQEYAIGVAYLMNTLPAAFSTDEK